MDVVGSAMLITHRLALGNKCICQKCGYEWFSKETNILGRYTKVIAPLLGDNTMTNIMGIGGRYLQINREGIIFFDSKNRSRAVLYNQIESIHVQSNIGQFYGWLSIRTINNRKKAFPTTYNEAKKDKMTIFCDMSSGSIWYEVAAVLGAVTKENKRAELSELHAVRLSKLLGDYTSVNYHGMNNTYIEITMDRLIIFRAGQRAYTMEYGDIAFVDFREQYGPLHGRLTVLDRENLKRKTPDALKELQEDIFAVFYSADIRKDFYELFCILKAIVQDNKNAGLL